MASYNSLSGLKTVEKSAEEATKREKVEKVVKGPVEVKKKGKIRKFFDSFMKQDARTVRDFVVDDIVVPAIKKTFIESVTSGLNMSLLGDSKATKVTKASRVSYSRMYDDDRYSASSRSAQSRAYDYDDIIFPEYSEAKDVLDRMYEILAEYRVVRVADYYDLAGVSERPYTDNRYGWTSLNGADVLSVRGGYIIKLPRALPID